MNRRDFLKKGIASIGLFAAIPNVKWQLLQTEWPDSERMGRNCTGGVINIRSRPSINSSVVDAAYEDAVYPWLREVVGEAPPGVLSKRWVETPVGYIYSPTMQPVLYKPNIPLAQLPDYGNGPGMWAEVTVPYVDLVQDNPPPRSPWLNEIDNPRLYYSQVVWIDDIVQQSDGNYLYRVNERYGSYGDIFWASGDAFRPITQEELEPISPEVENKKVRVDLAHQTLSCFEDNREVYFCRISSGARFNAAGEEVEEWSTPPGEHKIWRKLISIHMSGGGTGAGWDTPGVAWTSLFVGDGVAIHSTFWHNDFGTQRSHGCVNTKPEDAKWVFRWTAPHVPAEPGDLTITDYSGSTIEIIEG